MPYTKVVRYLDYIGKSAIFVSVSSIPVSLVYHGTQTIKIFRKDSGDS